MFSHLTKCGFAISILDMSSRREFCTSTFDFRESFACINLQQNNCWQSAVWQMLVYHYMRGESDHAHSVFCSVHLESACFAQSIIMNMYNNVLRWEIINYHRSPSVEEGCGWWSMGFSCWQCRKRGGRAKAASPWEGGVVKSTHNCISRTLQKFWCVWL